MIDKYIDMKRWQLLVEARKRNYTEASIHHLTTHGGSEALRCSLRNDDTHEIIARMARRAGLGRRS